MLVIIGVKELVLYNKENIQIRNVLYKERMERKNEKIRSKSSHKRDGTAHKGT